MSTFDTTTCPNFDRRGIIAYLGIAFGLAWAWWAVVLYGLDSMPMTGSLHPGHVRPGDRRHRRADVGDR